jgi:uncharacterized protein (DUF2249 family)
MSLAGVEAAKWEWTMNNVSTEPIQANWKISDVLKHYPDLLETIIGLSPAFSRLHNPVLRRVQARLVTVEQAAQIAGINAETMTARLNQAAGIEPVAADPAPAAILHPLQAEPEWARTAPVAVDLDVRPLHERGEEPFGAIMCAVREVAPGEVLQLRNSFEPVPLYDVLRMRGFEHVTRQLADDDWEILFFNSGAKAAKRSAPKPAEPSSTSWAGDETITIDVSELVPPEPMMRILGALEEMEPGKTLLVHHVRRPMFLYPQLDDLGYLHETRDLGPSDIEILIHKPEAAAQ